MSNRIKSTVALLLIAATILVVSSRATISSSAEPQSLKPAGPAKFGVSGFLVVGQSRTGDASLASSPSALKSAIYVPGVEVELRDLLTNTTVEKVRTDLSGRFRFAPQLGSRYQVCWKARGIVSACNKVFSIQNKHLYLGPLAMAVDLTNKGRTFFGKVRLADGSLPRTLEPMVGVNAFATVQATSNAGVVIGEAFVNNHGDYVIPGVRPEKTSPRRQHRVGEGDAEPAGTGRPVSASGSDFQQAERAGDSRPGAQRLEQQALDGVVRRLSKDYSEDD